MADTGSEAFTLPPLDPPGVTTSKSYIYWEINTPRGPSFKSPRKHNGGEAAEACVTIQRPPRPFGRQDGTQGEKKLRASVPFGFKGKQEDNRTSVSPERVFRGHERDCNACERDTQFRAAACIWKTWAHVKLRGSFHPHPKFSWFKQSICRSRKRCNKFFPLLL